MESARFVLAIGNSMFLLLEIENISWFSLILFLNSKKYRYIQRVLIKCVKKLKANWMVQITCFIWKKKVRVINRFHYIFGIFDFLIIICSFIEEKILKKTPIHNFVHSKSTVMTNHAFRMLYMVPRNRIRSLNHIVRRTLTIFSKNHRSPRGQIPMLYSAEIF